MMDRRFNSQIFLREIQGESVTDRSITELNKDTPKPEPVSTPVPRHSGRVVKTSNKTIFLRKSDETISKVHKQGPATYHKAITNIYSGRWQDPMKAKIESAYFNQV